MGPKWWEILIGVIFILVGASLFFLSGRSKASVQEYKQLQLEAYRKENPKFRGNYEQAKLLLPWTQRFKLCTWPIIAFSLIIIGITLSTGLVFRFFQR